MSINKIAFICAQGWEDILIWELQRLHAQSQPTIIAPGLVICDNRPPISQTGLTFARQWLPDIQEIGTSSVSKIADAILDSSTPLNHSDLPWVLHFITPDNFLEHGKYYQTLCPRMKLIQKVFLQQLQKYRPGLLKRLKKNKLGAELKSLLVLQVLFVDHGRVFLSMAKCYRLASGKQVPFAWSSYHNRIPEDPKSPCRSYYKIEEAWLETGYGPTAHDVCVDLGAAPGGWSWAALKRGAQVFAIDDADLAPHVESHPCCRHIRENAHAYMPDHPVDWMFCDIIAKPMATLGLLERWLEQKACRHFIVNVKFRGQYPATILEAIACLAQKYVLPNLSVRHLYHDHNEITLITAQ